MSKYLYSACLGIVYSTPKDNAVAERFMRTFKKHIINGKNIQEFISEKSINNKKIKSYRFIVRKYVEDALEEGLESVEESLQDLDFHKKVNQLLPKKKKYWETQLLRNPIN
jgi:protein tyrosine/serine phosphatase